MRAKEIKGICDHCRRIDFENCCLNCAYKVNKSIENKIKVSKQHCKLCDMNLRGIKQYLKSLVEKLQIHPKSKLRKNIQYILENLQKSLATLKAEDLKIFDLANIDEQKIIDDSINENIAILERVLHTLVQVFKTEPDKSGIVCDILKRLLRRIIVHREARKDTKASFHVKIAMYTLLLGDILNNLMELEVSTRAEKVTGRSLKYIKEIKKILNTHIKNALNYKLNLNQIPESIDDLGNLLIELKNPLLESELPDTCEENIKILENVLATVVTIGKRINPNKTIIDFEMLERVLVKLKEDKAVWTVKKNCPYVDIAKYEMLLERVLMILRETKVSKSVEKDPFDNRNVDQLVEITGQGISIYKEHVRQDAVRTKEYISSQKLRELMLLKGDKSSKLIKTDLSKVKQLKTAKKVKQDLITDMKSNKELKDKSGHLHERMTQTLKQETLKHKEKIKKKIQNPKFTLQNKEGLLSKANQKKAITSKGIRKDSQAGNMVCEKNPKLPSVQNHVEIYKRSEESVLNKNKKEGTKPAESSSAVGKEKFLYKESSYYEDDLDLANIRKLLTIQKPKVSQTDHIVEKKVVDKTENEVSSRNESKTVFARLLKKQPMEDQDIKKALLENKAAREKFGLMLETLNFQMPQIREIKKRVESSSSESAYIMCKDEVEGSCGPTEMIKGNKVVHFAEHTIESEEREAPFLFKVKAECAVDDVVLDNVNSKIEMRKKRRRKNKLPFSELTDSSVMRIN